MHIKSNIFALFLINEVKKIPNNNRHLMYNKRSDVLMLDIILDTILDSLKLVPFLFVAFLLIEVVEHKLNKKIVNIVSNSKRVGPLFGSLFGLFPQCGFSVLATNLYVTRIISLGTLISIYLSTSNEMLPILISNKAPINTILIILLIKFLCGLFYGFLIDLIYRNNNKKDYNICNLDECDCEHSILLSAIKHMLKTIIYIFIATFILNSIMYYVGEDVVSKLLLNNSIYSPFIASLIGLIPNCSSSIIITELLINNIITIGTTISGLLTNSGLALLVLFRSNKNLKENIFILLLIYFIGALTGLIINLI